MTGWVPYWDDSFSPVPISRLGEMYAAGYRVWARYVAGGSSGKWFTRPEIDAWFALGDDTGIFVLFESSITEPVDHPERGDDDARAARAAARALGVPDSTSICAAMDSNVDTAQWQGAIADYCRHWNSADTTKLMLYVEADAGSYLYANKLTAGTFTPAAWGWNNPPVLYTPANAPSHVMATQEHNGRVMAGGVVDIGHIRLTAPIWWAQPSNPGDGEIAVALTQDDANLIWNTPVRNDVTGKMVPAREFLSGLNTGVNDLRTNLVPDLAADEQADAATLADVKAAIAALPAAIAALPGAGPGGTLTEADVEQAVGAVLGRTTLNVTPPAAGSGS